MGMPCDVPPLTPHTCPHGNVGEASCIQGSTAATELACDLHSKAFELRPMLISKSPLVLRMKPQPLALAATERD